MLSESETLRLQATADDEFGRPATDVDDEPGFARARQLVGDAEIREPCLFVTTDDVDRKTDRAFGAIEEFRGILGHPKGVGRHYAYGRRVQSGEPFAKSGQTRERRLHGGRLQPAFRVEASAKAKRLPPGVELVDLVAFDPADFEPETV